MADRPQPPELIAAPGAHTTADRRRWAVLAVLCVSVFVIVVDGTIVNVALPTLVRELGATTSQLQWIVDAYTLVFAGLLLSAGSLADRFGRKGALQLGMLIFGVTSAAAAWSGSPEVLIFWRAAMGVGAALIFPATLAILVNVFTQPSERAKAIAIWAATSGLSVALGPLTGGWLLEHFWWGSIFLVNVPIVFAAVVVIQFVVPTSRDTTIARFDPLGMILSISGVSLLVWAIIEGPEQGWTSPATVGAFTVAAALLAIFIVWEMRIDHPMLDVRIFQNARFTAASLSVTLAFFALFGFVFLVTQYFQFVRGYGTLAAGVHTVPFAVFTGFAAPLSEPLARRFGTKFVVAGGLAAMAIGFSISAVLTATSPYLVVVVAMFFMGGGLGLVNTPATESIMGSLPPEKAGVGSAVNDTTRELGGTLGVAIVGSIFSSVYGRELVERLTGSALPAAALEQSKESVGAAVAVAQQASEAAGPQAGQAVKTAVDQAFMQGFHAGSWTVAAIALVGAIVALRFLPARASSADEIAPDADDVARGEATEAADAALLDAVGVTG